MTAKRDIINRDLFENAKHIFREFSAPFVKYNAIKRHQFGTILEISLVNSLKELHPEYEFIEPSTRSTLDDIYCEELNLNIEIKSTINDKFQKRQYQGDDENKIKEKESKLHDFVFIKYKVHDNGEIDFISVYRYKMPYGEWKTSATDYYITLKDLKDNYNVEQII